MMKLKNLIKEEFKASVSQSDVEKVTDWMDNAIPLVIDEEMQEKYDDAVKSFFEYLEIEQAEPTDAKMFQKNAEFSIIPLVIIASKVKEQLKYLKQLETKMPEVMKILTAVKKDLKQNKKGI